MADITVALPIETDTWFNQPTVFKFTITDTTVEMTLRESEWRPEERDARVIAIDKSEFLKLLRIVQL